MFCGLFPLDAGEFGDLRDALEKLSLNDSSFSFEAETSAALGFGFRCGFLGLLHMEIIRERLMREFNLELIATAPSVVYRINMTDGSVRELHNPADMPEVTKIKSIEEPWIEATIMTPDDFLGPVLTLCPERRGEQVNLTYAGSRAMVVYRLPLNEVVFDFYDRLKSVTKGYASLDYQISDYREGDLVKVSILVNSDPVDAFGDDRPPGAGRTSWPGHLRKAEGSDPPAVVQNCPSGGYWRQRSSPVRRLVPLRKDVTAKCYGGDISRKKKLLEKQKEGKKRMRQFGNVDIPQTAFLEALKMGDN